MATAQRKVTTTHSSHTFLESQGSLDRFLENQHGESGQIH
jgi:hypothetical protein